MENFIFCSVKVKKTEGFKSNKKKCGDVWVDNKPTVSNKLKFKTLRLHKNNKKRSIKKQQKNIKNEKKKQKQKKEQIKVYKTIKKYKGVIHVALNSED